MKFVYGWAFPDADEAMTREIKPNGKYSGHQLAAALKHVTDWSIAIDGGAHVGTWSRTLSGRFNRVIAVEPSPDTSEALLHNMAQFGCANVEVKVIALGEGPGLVSLNLDEKNTASKNTGARFATPGGDIPVESIDSWHLPSLGLLKLDIEGSEVFALRGAMETLKRCRPIVIYEDKALWRRLGQPRKAAETLMRDAHYRFVEAVRSDQIWVPDEVLTPNPLATLR
jgi:FkbM family methyltransferase